MLAPSLWLSAEEPESAWSIVLRQEGDAEYCCATVSWLKRERSARTPIDFRLDAAQPGKIVDLRKWRERRRPAMMVLLAAVEKPDAREIRHARSFRIEFVHEWKQGGGAPAAISSAATPFHTLNGLSVVPRVLPMSTMSNALIAIICGCGDREQVRCCR